MSRSIRFSKFQAAGVVALFITLLHSQAYAQQQESRPTSPGINRGLSVTPHVGLYVPVGSLVVDETVRLRPVTAIALGTRITLPVHGPFGLEGSATWSPNLVAQSDWKETIDLEGGVVFTSVRARFEFNHQSDRAETRAALSSGLGIVHRYGDAWTGLKGMTDPALVFAAGLRYALAETNVAFALDVEDYVSRTGYIDTAGRKYGGRLQSDFVVSFGASINLGR